jgi:hypothetical protein
VRSHSVFREYPADRDEAGQDERVRAREFLDAPFGLIYCISKGYRGQAEESLARLLAQLRHESREGWRPIEEAPDDLAEGLFAFPDGMGGYHQTVIYGYAPSRRRALSCLYTARGVRPDPDEPAPMSAKAIALESGATQWRPVPPSPGLPAEAGAPNVI